MPTNRTLPNAVSNFRIAGRMYHRIGPLRPADDRVESAQVLQIYIMDPNENVTRNTRMNDLLPDLLAKLLTMFA
jgi:hypothetical protein